MYIILTKTCKLLQNNLNIKILQYWYNNICKLIVICIFGLCFKEIEILVSAPWRGEIITPKHVGAM